jgi:hypothetical protein
MQRAQTSPAKPRAAEAVQADEADALDQQRRMALVLFGEPT